MSTLMFGSAIVDVILKLPHMPKSGGDVYVTDKKLVLGGCSINVANILQELNQKYTLLAPVGKGENADFVKAELAKRNHKTIISDPSTDNGRCMVFVEPHGERTFITEIGERVFKKEWLELIEMSDYKNIYIDGYQMIAEASKNITDILEDNKDKTIYFAPGPMINSIDKDIMDRILKLNPILHLNEIEAIEYTGKKTAKEAIKVLHERTNNLVVITHGSKGCKFIENNEIEFVETTPVEATNTNGAGDTHLGTLISYKNKGLSTKEALQKANARVAELIK